MGDVSFFCRDYSTDTYGAFLRHLTAGRIGKVVGSRLGDAYEVNNLTVTFRAGRLFSRPGMSRALGWLEACAVLAGVPMTQESIAAAAPGARWEYDESSQYGSRTFWQLMQVTNLLASRPSSRRGIVHIGFPDDLGDVPKPCVDSYTFWVRHAEVHCSAYVRSWDMVSGFIYDTMVMSMLTHAVASALKLTPGTITAFAASAHVYETDVKFNRIPDDGGLAGLFLLDNNIVHRTLRMGDLEDAEARLRATAAWALEASMDWEKWCRRHPPLGVLRINEDSLERMEYS